MYNVLPKVLTTLTFLSSLSPDTNCCPPRFTWPMNDEGFKAAKKTPPSNVASEASEGEEVSQALMQGDLFLIHLQGAQTGAP
jgi:hypothetical protein